MLQTATAIAGWGTIAAKLAQTPLNYKRSLFSQELLNRAHEIARDPLIFFRTFGFGRAVSRLVPPWIEWEPASER
jgi:hypothetical protein